MLGVFVWRPFLSDHRTAFVLGWEPGGVTLHFRFCEGGGSRLAAALQTVTTGQPLSTRPSH